MVRQVEQEPPQIQGESGGTGTVIGVSTFVHPLGVVEDGGKLHDIDVGTGLLGKPKPVFENPGPVGDAVDAIPREDILFEDGMEDQGDVQFQITRRCPPGRGPNCETGLLRCSSSGSSPKT